MCSLSVSRDIEFSGLLFLNSEVTLVGIRERKSFFPPLFRVQGLPLPYLMFWSNTPRTSCHSTNNSMKSVLSRDKLGCDEVWGTMRREEGVSCGNFIYRQCVCWWICNSSTPEKKEKLWFVVFANSHGANTPTCLISHLPQATYPVEEMDEELEIGTLLAVRNHHVLAPANHCLQASSAVGCEP